MYNNDTEMVQFIKEPKIAYFSMEIGILNEIRSYSGGLGVLAGDTIKSAADLKLPMVAVTLLSSKGYFEQDLDREGNQTEAAAEWEPAKFMHLLPNRVYVELEGREVSVQAWLFVQKSITGGTVPMLFLDTDVEGNRQEDRELTWHLYGGDDTYRLKQEAILGIAGVRMHVVSPHGAALTNVIFRRGAPLTAIEIVPPNLRRYSYEQICRQYGFRYYSLLSENLHIEERVSSSEIPVPELTQLLRRMFKD